MSSYRNGNPLFKAKKNRTKKASKQSQLKKGQKKGKQHYSRRGDKWNNCRLYFLLVSFHAIRVSNYMIFWHFTFLFYFPKGFAGELCDYEYNECESNPCLNDGECIDQIGGYECKCSKGYIGNRCQMKVGFDSWNGIIWNTKMLSLFRSTSVPTNHALKDIDVLTMETISAVNALEDGMDQIVIKFRER